MKQADKATSSYAISDNTAKKIDKWVKKAAQNPNNTTRKAYKLVEKMAQDPRYNFSTPEGWKRYADWHLQQYGYLPDKNE